MKADDTISGGISADDTIGGDFEMDELKACLCGSDVHISELITGSKWAITCSNCGICMDSWTTKERLIEKWNTRPLEDALQSELAALKSENVNLSKKVTDYEKELRQSYKYDKTCSTCRYLDENRNCVLGIRCVNYTLWQGKIL